jgi:linoleoyl-CoA desaturase
MASVTASNATDRGAERLETRLRAFRARELASRALPSRQRLAVDITSRTVPWLLGYAGMILLPYPTNLCAAAVLAVSTVSLLGSWFHDVVHKNLVVPRGVGYPLQRLGSSPVGLSPRWWEVTHVRLHHRYPGDPAFDPDIQFDHLARVCAEQAWRPIHATQHIHIWFFIPLTTLNMFKPSELWQARRHRKLLGAAAVPPAVVLLLDKYLGPAIVWSPLFVLRPVGEAALTFVAFHLLTGTLAAVITQVQHNTTLAAGTKESGAGGPLCDQLRRTADVGYSTGVWWWICGGVNFHVVHHIAPSLSFLELPRATARLRAAMKEWGHELPAHRGLAAAIASHTCLLRTLSRPAVADRATVAVADAPAPP